VSTVDAGPGYLERNTEAELWAMWRKVDGWLHDPAKVLNTYQRWDCTMFLETLKDELLRRACESR
jgi:hypothetical protein